MFRPLAREGQKKPASQWLVFALNPQTKHELWSQPLPAEPVRWGLAVDAQGRTLVSLRNGQLLCFGEKR